MSRSLIVILSVAMLNVGMLSVVMLNVVILGVVMLNVVGLSVVGPNLRLDFANFKRCVRQSKDRGNILLFVCFKASKFF